MTEQELADIEAGAAKATPGPWDIDAEPPRSCAAAIRHKWNGGQKTVAYVEGPGLSGLDQRRRAVGLANAAFIAGARAWVPELAAEVRRLRAVAAELLEEYRALRRWAYGETEGRSEAAWEEELRQEVERWRARVAGAEGG